MDEEHDPHIEDTFEESDDDKSFKDGDDFYTTESTDSDTHGTSKSQPKKHSNYTAARNRYIATSITRFGNSLSRIFCDRFDEQAKHATMDVDSRLKREIEAKKKGQNISM